MTSTITKVITMDLFKLMLWSKFSFSLDFKNHWHSTFYFKASKKEKNESLQIYILSIGSTCTCSICVLNLSLNNSIRLSLRNLFAIGFSLDYHLKDYPGCQYVTYGWFQLDVEPGSNKMYMHFLDGSSYSQQLGMAQWSRMAIQPALIILCV